LNLDRVEQIIPKFKIRDKRGFIVPLNPNPSQVLALKIMREAQQKGKPLWVIILKARRAGMSTLAEALLNCHCLTYPNARAKIIAHQRESAEALFEVARRMKESIPVRMPKGTKRVLVYPHKKGMSLLDHATAGSVSGGRGLSLSACHFSEASRFGGEAGSFTSLLPAVPYKEDTMVIVESTANGKIGDGQTFYEMWCDALEGRNEFVPIFIPWTIDPECTRDASEAEDAPVDEEEEELLAEGITLGQLAWRRMTMRMNCQGLPDLFRQEYPHSWQEAFIESGNPAFNRSERHWAAKNVVKPKSILMPIRHPNGTTAWRKDKKGLWVWETPQAGSKYYLGCDVARGGTDGKYQGDYSAICVWNGTTGEHAASFAERIGPEELADIIDIVGRYYNRAMVTVELTGGFGQWTQKILRDMYHYPNLYRWKGKDDAMPGKSPRPLLGWDTNYATRRMMFTAFRSALMDHRVIVRDERLVVQIESATYEEGYRWELEEGYDDLLVASMVAWIAREQYPPPRDTLGVKVLSTVMTDDDHAVSGAPKVRSGAGDLAHSLGRHLRQVMKAPTKSRLEGI
jgi:hypothetical protein